MSNNQSSVVSSQLSDKKGFTLIELLVAVAIVALLTVIGIAVYANTQGKARDARRRLDINAIAKVLEVYRNEDGTYQPLAITQFDIGTGIPVADTKRIPYCLAVNPASPPTSSGWDTTHCPSGWSQVAAGIPASGPTAWGVCAMLENDFTKADGTTTKIYCKFNNQ